ncbi:lytic transglycosylase domain-containing protein [Fictibacillus sp. 23RED33]|uniref:lytic transglycosylase domain-containing protein n=1 Tax=Fictibacillus sp. 23RED33 TaxID=2745879 RepID=UPI001E2EC063|nr:lytic transglycosylase domain-containing protein [Fictibacillus sp. 23RED33]
MLKKTAAFSFFAFLLCLQSPVEASLNEWESERQTLQQERESIKDQIEQLQTEIESFPEEQKEERETVINKKLKLGREYSKKAAYENAYLQAIEFTTGGSVEPEQASQNVFSFVPVKMLPGEAAPKEYIPLYKAAGERYGVDWFVLASIHKIETSYSRIPLMVSSVGAQGHMQFMPPTFAAYGVDGNGDGKRSPWNLEDAIFSAANYLSHSGYKKDIRKAIWHYNHAERYVNDVLETATQIRGSM